MILAGCHRRLVGCLRLPRQQWHDVGGEVVRVQDIRCGEAEPERRLTSVAARQYSVFTRREAVTAGMTGRMIGWRLTNGRWTEVHRGVYRFAGAPVTWHQRVMAACLAAGPDAVASHRSAAALWSMDGFEAGPVEVTSPVTPRVVGGASIHRSRSLKGADITRTLGIPVTTVARTLIDLASSVGDEDLEAALDWALREQRTTVAYLRRRLAALGSRGREGTARLRALLDDRERNGTFDSRPEARTSKLLVAAGLPPPVRQFRLVDDDGVLVARFDLSLPPARIAFEFESYRHHYGRQAWRRDVGRNNHAAAHGWLVFRVTEDDLTDPHSTLFARVTLAYALRLQDLRPATD